MSERVSVCSVCVCEDDVFVLTLLGGFKVAHVRT